MGFGIKVVTYANCKMSSEIIDRVETMEQAQSALDLLETEMRESGGKPYRGKYEVASYPSDTWHCRIKIIQA